MAEPATAGTSDGGTQAVGRVLGTEDATPLKFHVALHEDAYLQLDDVVVTVREVPGAAPVTIAGVVTEVTARHEGAQFASDVFLISDGVLPAQVQETAEITTTRVEPEFYVPPRPGALVRRAAGDDRARALYFDRMERQAAGRRSAATARRSTSTWTSSTAPAARTCRSAASPGVATKTSFALFLLHSLFRSGVLGARAINAKALIFSVKGEDLLFLDYANNRLDDDARAKYAAARAARRAVPVGRLLLPADPGRPDRPPARRPAGPAGSQAFWWTPAEFCAGELLPYVFADVDDERQQYTMVVHQVVGPAAPRRPTAGRHRRRGERRRRHLPHLRPTWSTSIVAQLTDDDTRADWAGPVTGIGTINAFIRRLRLVAEAAARR